MPSADDDASGHLIFSRGNTLVAQSVDFTTLAPLGEPVVIADDIGGDASQASGLDSVTASRALAYSVATCGRSRS